MFFIGVEPPAELAEQVRHWQGGWGHSITAAHVTLRAPARLSPDQRRACQEAVQRAHPFTVELGGVQTFSERVIYLEASGAGLAALHAALVAAVDLPAGEFELECYHPHLTLAYRPHTGSWPQLLASAETEFAGLAREPLRFQVRQAALFGKEEPGQPYTVDERWGLAGEAKER